MTIGYQELLNFVNRYDRNMSPERLSLTYEDLLSVIHDVDLLVHGARTDGRLHDGVKAPPRSVAAAARQDLLDVAVGMHVVGHPDYIARSEIDNLWKRVQGLEDRLNRANMQRCAEMQPTR